MNEGLARGYLKVQVPLDYSIRFQPGESIVKDDDFYPNHKKIPQRIKEICPNVKILITIRNQVDWLRSYYLYFIKYLPKKRKKFKDFISTREGKNALFAGLFHQTISDYYELFDKENVLVMLLEEFKNDRERSFQKLCAFLNVSHTNLPKEKERRNLGIHKSSGNLIKLGSSLGLSTATMGIFQPYLRPLKKPLSKIFGHDVLNNDDFTFLQSFYSVSNFYTNQMLDRKLSHYGYPI